MDFESSTDECFESFDVDFGVKYTCYDSEGKFVYSYNTVYELDFDSLEDYNKFSIDGIDEEFEHGKEFYDCENYDLTDSNFEDAFKKFCSDVMELTTKAFDEYWSQGELGAGF